MKTFGRLLGIFALFLAGFFLIGVLIPILSYDIELEIDQPRNAVFQAITDSELLPKWVSGLESSELLEGRTGKPGSVYQMILKDGGRIVKFNETVIRFEPDSILTYSIESQGLKGDISISLINMDSRKTKLAINTRLHGTVWFTSSLLPLIQESLKARNEKDYRKLKSILERS